MNRARAAVPANSVIVVRREVPGAEWDRYVHTNPDASVYHLGAWAGIMERCFGHRAHCFTARVKGHLAGILPVVGVRTSLFGRFAISMPFLNYGGIVADDEETAERLLEAAIEDARRSKAAYLELRHTARRFERLPVQTHKVAMILPLPRTTDEQWDGLDRKLRNQIRKAEKSGLTVQAGGAELLKSFYSVLAHNMRDLGSPVHSRRFFGDILHTFPDRAQIFCVMLGSIPVASSLVLWHGDRLEVPWASAVRRYNPLCPNVLLYWAMLKFGIERGFAAFDFGRSTPHEGTYRFKEQWGAQPQQLYWEYWLSPGTRLPDRSPKNPRFSAAISLWRRLPVSVTRTLGPLIVRGIP